MGLMNPIPIEAMPVLEVLRRDVPRPDELPSLIEDRNQIRIVSYLLRWGMNCDCYCPMGLHPNSTYPRPFNRSQFAGGICNTYSIVAFYGWWDGERDAQAAYDAVWPE